MSSTQTGDSELYRGLMLPNIGVSAQRLVEYGVAAEEAGWDGVFLIDQLVLPGDAATATLPDPWITLTGIAARTDEIRVGSYVTPVPRRQPWQLARDLATLDRLSEGRVIFGAGLGRDYDYTTFGHPYDLQQLGQKYDEALEVITGLWQGDQFSYDGEHYTIDEAVMRPTPVQKPRIPVIIAGLWPNKKPFHRGARWDGIMPHYRGDGVLPKEGIDGLVPGAEVDPEEDVRELLSYYHGIDGEPGEVFLPADPPHRSEDWLDLCKELGATWVVTRPRDQSGEWNLSMEQVRNGPQNNRISVCGHTECSTRDMTRKEEHKALVRRYFEALNDRDKEAFRETMAEDFTYGDIEGPEKMIENDWKWLEAMDLTWEILAMHAGEDFVTTRVQATGTHQGEILGLEPTGESFNVTAMTLSSIEDGKIVEWWAEWDFAGLLNQIGAIDSPVYND